MTCRRAPEFASGKMFQFLRILLNAGVAALSLDLAAALVLGSDQVEVLREFATERAYIWFTFVVKFSFWQCLPWSLFGLGHTDEAVARMVANSCLQQFATLPVGSTIHWLVLVFFVGDSVVAHELRLFAAGAARTTLPVLMRFMARFRFALTSERWIEALHAAARHFLTYAHHAGPAHIGFHSVLPVIRKRLERDKSILDDLARHCTEIRNLRMCLHKFGLSKKPEAELLLGRSGSERVNKRGVQRATRILYHVDRATLYSARLDLI